MATKDDRYAAAIFFNAVLPLVREIAERTSLKKAFANKSGVLQISATDEDKMWATHFVLEDGVFTTKLGAATDPDVELRFPNLAHFNAFFRGTTKKLPKIRGFTKLSLLVPFLRTLLKMQKLLGSDDIPADEETKELMTRLYFYLLSSGISQLNKQGHPAIVDWVKMSPNRIYAWSVDGHEDVAAHLRIQAGKSKAMRGPYTRSQPFFKMRFDSFDSALAILLGKGDMIEMIASGQMILDGAPEFGAKIGEYMLLVGSYAKA
ncbi:MAG TPA: hypothetical protein GXZ89_00050 [Fastidiosipila sp.]|nr:hypothetical protein [Fastidiosipila sp.]